MLRNWGKNIARASRTNRQASRSCRPNRASRRARSHGFDESQGKLLERCSQRNATRQGFATFREAKNADAGTVALAHCVRTRRSTTPAQPSTNGAGLKCNGRLPRNTVATEVGSRIWKLINPIRLFRPLRRNMTRWVNQSHETRLLSSTPL